MTGDSEGRKNGGAHICWGLSRGNNPTLLAEPLSPRGGKMRREGGTEERLD